MAEECGKVKVNSGTGVDAVKRNCKDTIPFLILIIYVFTVLWYTVLKRSTDYRMAQVELFWSYKKWFAGDAEIGKEIMANIAMFLPLGFLLSAVHLPSGRDVSGHGVRIITVVIAAAALSMSIEILQLILIRGLFEWDDLVSNMIGALAGACLCKVIAGLMTERHFHVVFYTIGAVIVIICAGVYLNGRSTAVQKADNTSRAYCFQIDGVTTGPELTLTGFAFLYKHEPANFTLMLRSTATGKKLKLSTTCQIPRPDVNDYFACEYDCTASGFSATADPESFAAETDLAEEYEVLIRWPWSVTLPTGVFITGGDVHYAPVHEFEAPKADGTELEKIVEDGTLRVYRPDFHCWVYQHGWALYWIVDRDFYFEPDGTTYIQYQLCTTQTENLPEKRLAHGNLWDNIGGHFEKYEIEGDFGEYRVMKREIPTEYSVTSIVTGYYKNGEWIWKNYFRPLYEF